MKQVTDKKLEDAITNAERYIQQMIEMDDKKLVKHLYLFKLQKQMAYEQKNHSAFNLLEVYEGQVLEARVRKNCP